MDPAAILFPKTSLYPASVPSDQSSQLNSGSSPLATDELWPLMADAASAPHPPAAARLFPATQSMASVSSAAASVPATVSPSPAVASSGIPEAVNPSIAVTFPATVHAPSTTAHVHTAATPMATGLQPFEGSRVVNLINSGYGVWVRELLPKNSSKSNNGLKTLTLMMNTTAIRRNGKEFEVDINYEHMPVVCKSCGSFGHASSICTGRSFKSKEKVKAHMEDKPKPVFNGKVRNKPRM